MKNVNVPLAKILKYGYVLNKDGGNIWDVIPMEKI